MKVSTLWAALLGLLASACSPVSLLNATIPTKGYAVVPGLAYGTEHRQQLDLYIPDYDARPLPVVLFFYGGSWQWGRKEDYRFLGQALAAKGYLVAVADYRLAPEVAYPTFLQDGAQAFAWLHTHVAAHGGDPGRMHLAGHSAGAYNALMLAVEPSYLRAAGADPAWVKSVIGIAGPYNFLPLTDEDLIALFGGKNRPETQPIHHVRARTAPALLLTGDDDTEVKPRNTATMAQAMRKQGTEVTEKHYPGVGHIGIILAAARGFQGKAPTVADMDAFLKAH